MVNHYLLDLPAVVSFSGGRTSGYMLRKILDAHGGKVDGLEICFQNTGLEHPATLQFIEDCSRMWEVDITWLEYDLDGDGLPTHRVVDFETASRDGEPFTKLVHKRKFLPTPVARICTANLKVYALRSYLKTLPSFSEEYTNAVGLRSDEPRRALRIKSDREREDIVCPLYHAGVTRLMVDEWWSKQLFNLNLPLGGNFAGNCVGCFLKGRNRLEYLMKEMPEHFDWWVKAEAISTGPKPQGGRFRNDRPSYKEMTELSKKQGFLFPPSDMVDDDTIPCMCTD